MKLTPYFLLIILLISSYNAFAYTSLVKTGDSDAKAKSELLKVFQQGGEITFEEGNWTINLSSSESAISKDVTIIGANVSDTIFNRGAYEDAARIKSTLYFSGARFSIKKGCTQLNISNIVWKRAGFSVDNLHLPKFDFYNVVFDITDAKNAFVDKQVFRALDGFEGSIKNVSFRGFVTAIANNRSLQKGVAPVTTRGTLIFDQCLFNPDEDLKTSICQAMTIDAGNDEYPVVWDQGGSEIKNSHLVDCRLAMSKCSNFKFINNICELEQSKKETLHIEEFSNNLIIKGNTFKLLGSGNRSQIISLGGAVQTSYDVLIEDNVVDHRARLGSFVIGGGCHDITIKGNEVLNPEAGQDAYISFWACNNININVAPGQPGLDAAHLSINTGRCADVIAEDTYTIAWNQNEYLAVVDDEVVLVNKTTTPQENNFIWKIIEHQNTGRNNYFSLQNAETGKYLQVRKGPLSQDQNKMMGQPYYYFGEKVYASTEFDFDASKTRVPGFGIFKDGTSYALTAGGNETRTQIIKEDSKVVLSVIKDATTADYNWHFVKARVAASISELHKQGGVHIYPNPIASNEMLSIDLDNSRRKYSEIMIMDMAGRSHLSLQLNDKTVLPICLSTDRLDSGVYAVHVKGDAVSICERLIVR